MMRIYGLRTGSRPAVVGLGRRGRRALAVGSAEGDGVRHHGGVPPRNLRQPSPESHPKPTPQERGPPQAIRSTGKCPVTPPQATDRWARFPFPHQSQSIARSNSIRPVENRKNRLGSVEAQELQSRSGHPRVATHPGPQKRPPGEAGRRRGRWGFLPSSRARRGAPPRGSAWTGSRRRLAACRISM